MDSTAWVFIILTVCLLIGSCVFMVEPKTKDRLRFCLEHCDDGRWDTHIRDKACMDFCYERELLLTCDPHI